MAIKLTQGLKQTQSLMMTPQLQQAIKLLTLTHLEMTKVIADEMVENPLLEEMESGPIHRGDGPLDYQIENMERQNREATSENFSQTEFNRGQAELDWDSYVESHNVSSSNSPPPPSLGSGNFEDGPNYENMLAKSTTLAEHLQWQLRMESLTSEELEIAEFIIHNLNDDGHLMVSLEEIEEKAKISNIAVREILSIIQNLDPVGCATEDLKECLLIQAYALKPLDLLVIKIIKSYLHELQQKDYLTLVKNIGASLDEIKNAEVVISCLNPWPGRSITPDETQYVVPDIYIFELGGKLVVSLNEEGVPRLKISQLYDTMVKDASIKNDDKAKEYVHDKYRSAQWLIKSIQNRQRTIVKVTEAIVRHQPEFFRKGPKFLRPMILKDIAMEIGVHESTVSRVTLNKYVHTPIGLLELKYFFNAGLGGKNGGIDIAGETLKLKIKGLIDLEDPGRPLSDQKIAEILEKEEVSIARRTVAKYRELLNIAPSSKRKKIKKK